MSLARVLRLLQLLAGQPPGMALAELCESMHAPKTSVLSLLRGLTAHGYLQRSGAVYRITGVRKDGTRVPARLTSWPCRSCAKRWRGPARPH